MVAPVIELGWGHLALLLVLVVLAIALSRWLRLGLAGDFALGAGRAVVQLAAVGMIIGWVFRQATWYWILGLLSVMALIAGYTGARRTGIRMPGLALLFTGVLACVTAAVMVYLTQAVLGVREWNPRYLITLGGMLLGNSMTAATLGVERLVSELRRSAGDVEVLLALGASPGRAVQPQRTAAVRAAITPTLNGMMVVGIVTMPGMMTGQMLGGTPPFQAAMYQLLILIGVTVCALVSAALMVTLLYRRFFTAAEQLDREALPPAG